MEDLQAAVIKVIAGPEKKSRVVPQHERKLTAYHEAGHAVMHEHLPVKPPGPQQRGVQNIGPVRCRQHYHALIAAEAGG